MNNGLRTEWLNTKNILVLIIGIVAMYFIATTLVNNRLNEIETISRIQIAEQGTALATISEITARNGADAVTESIVQDCTIDERSQFDTLLGQLNNNLSHNQLTELERLFGRCGSFFSERKSMMVSRLSREIDVYEDYVKLLSEIVNEDLSPTFRISDWQALATEERKQGELFSQLVKLQDKIIATLLEGKGASSPEIVEILQEVREVKENLLIANKQATNIRTELVSL